MKRGGSPTKPHCRKETTNDRLPGDTSNAQLVEQIVRVDQAGESGAVHIYEGQLAILGKCNSATVIRHMARQEQKHLETFDRLMIERRVRPTVFSPLWSIAGYALGAGTALIGEKAALACTVAVEEVIDEHYASQAEALGEDEKDLRDVIIEARNDELDHRDAALEYGAREAPGYEAMSAVIKLGSRIAIWLSQRA